MGSDRFTLGTAASQSRYPPIEAGPPDTVVVAQIDSSYLMASAASTKRFAAHADGCMTGKQARERGARELRALVGAEDLKPAVASESVL
ncbi:hypothetical protein CO683_37815 [Bradyrhizobium ottawaense]|nr:hypothetical protein CO683_37815 [Bradyrhizobium ottawaense]